MPAKPPIADRSHSLEEMVAGRQIAGPSGYMERSSSEDYIDARELCVEYRQGECWNCGHTRWLWRRGVPWNVCKECFMGQRQHDHEAEYTTPEGYTDYRLLWYGDVSIAEAKRRFDSLDTGRSVHAMKRVVRL